MTYTLILYIFAGPLAHDDSVTLTTIDTFSTIESCQEAGQAGKPLTANSTKEYRYVCIPKK
nr:MAG: hypothetical protein [Caudoviricetes sp.]QMP83762.1 MAG: hypothetical protein [Caudoviricetes sp.]